MSIEQTTKQTNDKKQESIPLLSGSIVVPLKPSSFSKRGMCDLNVPAGCNLIVVSTNNGCGWRPRMMLLPHQLYFETIEELFKESPDTRWVGVHPVRSEECIEVYKGR